MATKPDDKAVIVQGEIAQYYKTAPTTDYMPLGSEPSCDEQRELRKMTFGQHLMHKFAFDHLAAPENKRGMLVWHSTGTGKTCVAAGIMDAFVKTGKNVFYISTYQGLRSNNEQAFAQCAAGLFPGLKTDLETNRRRYYFTTIRKFANAVSGREFVEGSEVLKRKEALENSLIIIDEIHKLFDPKALDAMYYREAQTFLRDMRREHPGCVVILMTATPGKTVAELCELFNMVRDPVTPEVTFADRDKFKEQIRGTVSYIDMSHDRKIFPNVVETLADVLMSPAQQTAYMERHRKDDLRGCRRYCNSLFERKGDMPWNVFSPKADAICQVITTNADAKHYVYSCFHDNRGTGGHGIRVVAAMLESMGYTQLTPDHANDRGKAQGLKPARRFILLTNKDVANGSVSEKVESDNLSALMAVFNQRANATGSIVHVVLASQGYNESVDLHAVQYVHMMEPQLHYIDELQALGRAARRCSHKDLPKPAKIVHMIRYLACKSITDHTERLSRLTAEADLSAFLLAHDPTPAKQRLHESLMESINRAKAEHTDDMTTDHLVHYNARRLHEEMEQALDIVRASAVDCMVTAQYHGNTVSCSG